jgi:predicted nuclease of predicted toxin-antitoxin system
MLDENVPQDVTDMLTKHGHKAEFIREYVPPGAPDPLVATVSEELNAILVSFDGDFERIAPRIPRGHRARFRRLSRIWMCCGEPQAAERLKRGLPLVQAEYELAQTQRDRRMLMWSPGDTTRPFARCVVAFLLEMQAAPTYRSRSGATVGCTVGL